MIDPSEHEIEAMLAASAPAGEYLESIGQTDLAQLDENQWMTFIEVVCTNYVDKLRSLKAADGEAPF